MDSSCIIGGFCEKESPLNACVSCLNEYECGNTDSTGTYCIVGREASCDETDPAYCTNDSPSNKCESCSSESDCGGPTSNTLCSTSRDPKCDSDPDGDGEDSSVLMTLSSVLLAVLLTAFVY